jgi:phospholipid N-methyltransferase
MSSPIETKKYPWLSIAMPREAYLKPDYYGHILKEYIFDGRSDLEFLKERAGKIRDGASILELGPGNGRATEAALNAMAQPKKLTLVDLSSQMLEYCKKKFADRDFLDYIKSDAVDFLASTQETYDFVFSLWSFSHSVHQNLQDLGLEKGGEKIRDAITKFLRNNIQPGGSFFLIHFDSLSPEQRISIKQRRRAYPIFANNKQQSPSKLLIDEVLTNLKSQGLIDFTCTHYDGKPIEFASLNEALEYYTNFHMECHFNNSPDINEIMTELSADIEKCRDVDGVIRIMPGCFIYDIGVPINRRD